MVVTTTTLATAEQLAVWRDAAELAEKVRARTEGFPAEDHDWLTEPMRHAAESAADRIAAGWHRRGEPTGLVEQLTAAEADLHELQTWALLAHRHHHWSHDVADGIDRRCEAILDVLADMAHAAARGCGPAAGPMPIAA